LWPQLGRLTLQLAPVFLFPSINLYLSPPGETAALPLHSDAQDVFIMQIAGAKRWKVWHPPIRMPLKHHELNKRHSTVFVNESSLGSPYCDILLKTGDLLYVPRGHPHITTTVESDLSLHLTFTAQTQVSTWSDALRGAVYNAVNNSTALRRAFDWRAAINGGRGTSSWQSKLKGIRTIAPLWSALKTLISTQNILWTAGSTAPWTEMVNIVEPTGLLNATVVATASCGSVCEVCPYSSGSLGDAACRSCKHGNFVKDILLQVQSQRALGLNLKHLHASKDIVASLGAVRELLRIGCVTLHRELEGAN